MGTRSRQIGDNIQKLNGELKWDTRRTNGRIKKRNILRMLEIVEKNRKKVSFEKKNVNFENKDCIQLETIWRR